MPFVTPAGIRAITRLAEDLGLEPELFGIVPGNHPWAPTPSNDTTPRSIISAHLTGERPYDRAGDVIEELLNNGYEIVPINAATVALPIREVPYRSGAMPTSRYLREVARRLDRDYHPGGSNVRATVATILRDYSDALDSIPPANQPAVQEN
jgi:hypothetical protein